MVSTKVLMSVAAMAGATLIYLIIRSRRHERYSLSGSDSSKCGSHCFEIGNEISDKYDCCECRAIVSGNFEPNFHGCMCDSGYSDYCYRPVTNLLLSQ